MNSYASNIPFMIYSKMKSLDIAAKIEWWLSLSEVCCQSPLLITAGYMAAKVPFQKKGQGYIS